MWKQVVWLGVIVWADIAKCCYWLRSLLHSYHPPAQAHTKWMRRSFQPYHSARGRRKPQWVRDAVLALSRELPHAGCRSLAHHFNLLHCKTLDTHGRTASVSKSFVAQLLSAHRLSQMQQAAHKKRREPILTTWGIDLSTLPMVNGASMPVYGVIDHGSRAMLTLKPVTQYNSLILLGELLIAMGNYGKPRSVRSDNDAVFKTPLFRATLKILNIRQQHTQPGSPWQNGRIERFWRTLKEELQTSAKPCAKQGIRMHTRMRFVSTEAMHKVLQAFKASYNTHRPHQSLKGQTPATVWNKDANKAKRKRGKIKDEPDS